MLRKAKKIWYSLVDKLYQWALKKNQVLLEQQKEEDFLQWLLANKIPGAKSVHGYKDDNSNGWIIFIEMEMSMCPEYGKESTRLRMKTNNQYVISKSLSIKDVINAIMMAAQWDDIVCSMPHRFKPMLNRKDEIEVLKRGTTIEELKVKYDLREKP